MNFLMSPRYRLPYVLIFSILTTELVVYVGAFSNVVLHNVYADIVYKIRESVRYNFTQPLLTLPCSHPAFHCGGVPWPQVLSSAWLCGSTSPLPRTLSGTDLLYLMVCIWFVYVCMIHAWL